MHGAVYMMHDGPCVCDRRAIYPSMQPREFPGTEDASLKALAQAQEAEISTKANKGNKADWTSQDKKKTLHAVY